MGKRAPALALKWPLNDILFWVETLDTTGFIKEQNCIVVELVKFTDKWKEKCYLVNRVQLFVTPWAGAHQAPLFEFSRQQF